MSVPLGSKRQWSSSNDASVVKRFAVEGNIAAGKSTFLELLEKAHPEYIIVNEPLVRWQNVPDGEEGEGLTCSQQHGGNMLDHFYKDPQRWGYTFQTYACLSRLRMQMRGVEERDLTPPVTVQLFERSAYSDRYCFAQNLAMSGVISRLEWNLYCDWHSFLLDVLPVGLDGIIYLKTTPEKCMERLKHRNRQEEQGVSMEYLSSLHQRHEDWLSSKEMQVHKSISGAPVLVLESNPDLLDPQNDEEKKKIFEKVHQFVTTH